MARKRKPEKKPGVYSQFKQDIIGIFLIAFAAFILMTNLSSSTGLVGFFLVKTVLKTGFGVGVFVVPFFLMLLGVIIMIRQEVTMMVVRLLGLLLSFLTFILAAQFYAPAYFTASPGPFSGGGGVVGYGIAEGLKRVVGLTGSYISIAAIGAIALLLIFNTTVIHILSRFFRFIAGAFARKERKEDRKIKQKVEEVAQKVEESNLIPSMMPVLKEMHAEKIQVEEELREREDRVEKKFVVPPKKKKKRYGGYEFPPVDLLDLPTDKEKQREERLKETTELRKKILEEALKSFGVAATVVNVSQGPAVTRYELQPEPGVKVSRIAGLADDIALNLASQGVRIEAPVPGKSVVGIEVPNSTITPVRLGEIVRTPEFSKSSSKLFLALGKDLSGMPVFGDLTKMPHLLIAGTTGSGKSVCINSLIVSILLRARPDEVKFMMIDPKMVELSVYDGIPHLLAPVVTDSRRAALMLKEWVMKEMERRYRLFHEKAVRNLEAYNTREPEDALPYILVIVDELADLMMVAAAEVETSICRIAQMARATGIHLVIATQRPSVDVITGLIKANIPSRIAFAVATQVDSRVILDQGGAEKLLGRGDALYHPIGSMKSTRIQGSFVSDEETERIIKFVKEQAQPEYLDEIMELKPELTGGSRSGERGEGGRDTLFAEAAAIIVESGQASTSHLQRRLRIGYNRAARLMDEMEAAGIVSKFEGENKPRRILASRDMLKTLGAGED